MPVPDQVLTALRTRLLTVAGLPAFRYWENIIPSTSATNKDAYSRDALALGSKRPLSLAVNAAGRRWWRWEGALYRVTLHYPANTHLHAPLIVADAVAVAFQASSLATVDGTKLNVDSSRIPAASGDDTGTALAVEIRFHFDQFDP